VTTKTYFTQKLVMTKTDSNQIANHENPNIFSLKTNFTHW